MATLLGGPESDQERTESATPKRRDEARKEGRVPRSQELSGAALLLAAACSLGYAGGSGMARQARLFLQADLQWLGAEPLTPGGAAALLGMAGAHLMTAFLPFALVVMGVSLFIGVVQGRGVITLQPLEPKLSNLNPLAGLGKLISIQAPFALLKSLVKFAVLGGVTYLALRR